jgi:hypothetical protein
VAATGDYDDLANQPISKLDSSNGKFYGTDRAGRVVFTHDGVTYAMRGIALVAGGTSVFDDLQITLARLGGANITAGDGTGYNFIDRAGRRMMGIDADGVTIGAVRFSTGDGAGGWVVIDRAGRVFSQIDGTGGTSGWGGGDTTAHTADEIARRHAENLAAVGALAVSPISNIARPVWKRSHFLIYGQSLSTGSEGTPVSTVAVTGTLMYGGDVRPITGTATSVWDRVGGDAFNALVTSASGEVPVAGALRFFRRLWLDWRGVASDSSIEFVGNSTGVGGQAIAALSKGASPNIFNRVISCADQAQTRAVADGHSYGVAGILWMQGESNQTTPVATYQAALETLIDDILADIQTETAQARPPGFFTYQTATNPNFDTNDIGTSQAQLNVALADPRVTMIGPVYPYPDSANLHLVGNPYRWVGAQFGKVMHRVLNLGQRFLPLHMRQVTRRGVEVLIDFHVPVPPLVFEDPWLQSGFSGSYGVPPLAQTNTQYAVPDKGFTVRNMTTAANLTIASVALVSTGTQVLITLASEPASGDTIAVRYADGAHYGHGSLRDSDPTTADDVWEHVAGRTDADTNATLLGLPYALHNWGVAQHIEVT